MERWPGDTTVADTLRCLAAMFHQSSHVAAMLGLATDPTFESDLRTWAAWLDEHPEIDRAMAALSSLAQEEV